MTTITLAQADIMINAVFAEARRIEQQTDGCGCGCGRSGGSVISFKKKDDSSMMRFEMVNGKCYASSSLVHYRAEQRPIFMD